MHPIFIIAQREFLQRIRQKAFWILMLLGPIFFLLSMIVPIGLSMKKETASQILYLDDSSLLSEYLYSDPTISFVETAGNLADCKQKAANFDGFLWITKDSSGWKNQFFQSSMIDAKDPSLLKYVLKDRITEYEIESKTAISIPKIAFKTANFPAENAGAPDQTIGFVMGLFGAILIIVFINQYANMVLRGIVEEKQNRISELILTSIKPMNFITGKIIGIASVAFLQMFAWFSMAGIISFSVHKWFKLERFSDAQLEQTLRYSNDMKQSLEMNSLLNAFSTLDFGLLFAGFVFYFVFGYLLFSALFAIVGVSVGSETDAQQMAMPFSLPLAIPVMLLQYIGDNPDSNLVHFLSLFPLTSPTTMLLRLPMGVPMVELLLSMSILIATFFLAAFVASKVYRAGVLMYGKKLRIADFCRWRKFEC